LSRFSQAPLALAAVAVTSVLALGGCAGDAWDAPHASPSLRGSLGAGFEPASAPAPEATITPVPGSWDAARPSRGYRVVLLTSGDDAPTRALVAAVRDWADEEDVDLRTVQAGGNLIDGVVAAIDLRPDLVVSAGNALVDPLATVTANHLDQRFLVVGAELAEPTHNVTAVDWEGASFRGEGLGTSSAYDAASFTVERCAAAVRAGVAAVLSDLTGIVVWID